MAAAVLFPGHEGSQRTHCFVSEGTAGPSQIDAVLQLVLLLPRRQHLSQVEGYVEGAAVTGLSRATGTELDALTCGNV